VSLGQSPSDERQLALDPIWSAIGQISMCWHPIFVGDVNERQVALEGACHFVKFDCTPLIAKIECSGSAPYVNRLRRKLRNTLVVSVPDGRVIDMNLENTWEARQFQQVRPFAPMKHDRIFLSESKFTEASRDLFKLLSVGSLNSRILALADNDKWRILDSAITSNCE